jgi:hypothetical protein
MAKEKTENDAKSTEVAKKSLGIFAEFKQFLDEYKVMGLAVAFIIGVAATALIQSLVNNIKKTRCSELSPT